VRKRLAFARVAGIAAVVPLALAAPAQAGPPDGFVVRTLVRGLDSPTAFAFAPDGRIFITEKSGTVRVFQNGRLHQFLDLSNEVNRYSDRGLLSVALDPSFERNRRIYLLFTRELKPANPDSGSPAGGRLIRIEASRRDPTVADASTRATLVSGFKSTGPWHSVGGLDFDRRGRLVVGFGDGSPYCVSLRCQRTGSVEPFKASAYAPFDLESVNGKVLRIDPEAGHGVPDNPFYDPSDPAGVRSMILAYGVRTPFRVQVDRETDEIYVGDVGTDQWDEINLIPPSWDDPETELNFGWPCYEGGGDGEPQHARDGDPYCVSRYYEAESELTTPPWFAYPIEKGAALILGPWYRANSYPSEYVGDLFFGDWKRDAFWTYSDELQQFGTSGSWGQPVDLHVSPRGNIAYLAIGTGRLNEIVYVGGEQTGTDWAAAGRWIGLGAAAVAVALLVLAGYWSRRRRSPKST
jgi:glucose/arabinose dehydrogenase